MTSRIIRAALTSTLCLALGGLIPPVLAATDGKAVEKQYSIGKVPTWVEPILAPSSVPRSLRDAGSIQMLLSDIQVNLAMQKPVTYYHFRAAAQERSGLEGMSTLRIQFNPRFQTLTLHDLVVYRDGKRIDRLKTARIDLVQLERHLEDGVYDEDVDAVVAIADIRVGDQVEYAYSIAGDNPIFAGKYSAFFMLNRDQPIAQLAIRIRYPADRKLNYRLYRSDVPLAETVANGEKRLGLDAENLPPVQAEQATPAWFSMYPWLQVSEYASWEEVGNWANNLYKIPLDLSPEIEAVIAKLKREAKSPEELVAATLAWVQNEIRYYSIAVGSSSHRPNPPNLTVRQRFGDCKDKSLLLSAMLHRLGIQATPALVSSQIRKGIAELLPTPRAFDHVIVRAQIGNQTYWLDGTRTYQGQSLASLGYVPFAKALSVTTPPNRELSDVTIPAESRMGTEVIETFHVEKYGTPATLLLQQKYYGSLAEWLRTQIGATGVRRAVESLLADYQKDFPNIVLTGDANVDDDLIGNVMTLTQSFIVPNLFSYEAGRATMQGIYGRSIIPFIRYPGSPERKFPLALSYPGTFNHRIILDLPNKLPTVVPPPQNWEDSHYVLGNRISIDGSRATFDFNAGILQDSVSAADFPVFAEKFKKGSELLFSSVALPLIESQKLRDRLNRDLRESGTNLRKPDQLDNLTQNFVKNFAIADESILSGLLTGPMLAKAYRDRSEAADTLGRRADALADVNSSIELDPNDAAYILKAEILIYQGRYADALETLRHARHDSGKTNVLVDIGVSNYFLERFEEAQQSFSAAAEVSGSDELPYSLIWLALATTKAGHNANDAVGKFLSQMGTAWPAEAVSYLTGSTDEADVIAAAKEPVRNFVCEA